MAGLFAAGMVFAMYWLPALVGGDYSRGDFEMTYVRMGAATLLAASVPLCVWLASNLRLFAVEPPCTRGATSNLQAAEVARLWGRAWHDGARFDAMSGSSKDRFYDLACQLMAEHPLVPYSTAETSRSRSLRFEPQDDDGFAVEVEAHDGEVLIHTAGIDSYTFPLDEDPADVVTDVFSVVRDLLSPHMRLRAISAGKTPYKFIVESWNGTSWDSEHTTTSLAFNYFAKRTERIYINRHLPGRLAETDPTRA